MPAAPQGRRDWLSLRVPASQGAHRPKKTAAVHGSAPQSHVGNHWGSIQTVGSPPGDSSGSPDSDGRQDDVPDDESLTVDRGKPAGKNARGRSTPSDPDDDQSALGIYFREMAAVSVMTPAQEQEAAEKLPARRTSYGRAIFPYPPFIPGFALFIGRVFPEDVRPVAEVEAIRE